MAYSPQVHHWGVGGQSLGCWADRSVAGSTDRWYLSEEIWDIT